MKAIIKLLKYKQKRCWLFCCCFCGLLETESWQYCATPPKKPNKQEENPRYLFTLWFLYYFFIQISFAFIDDKTMALVSFLSGTSVNKPASFSNSTCGLGGYDCNSKVQICFSSKYIYAGREKYLHLAVTLITSWATLVVGGGSRFIKQKYLVKSKPVPQFCHQWMTKRLV